MNVELTLSAFDIYAVRAAIAEFFVSKEALAEYHARAVTISADPDKNNHQLLTEAVLEDDALLSSLPAEVSSKILQQLLDKGIEESADRVTASLAANSILVFLGYD